MRHGIQGIAFDLDGTLYPNYQFNLRLLPFTVCNPRLLSGFGKARSIIRKEQTMKDFVPYKADEFYKYQTELVLKVLRKPSGAESVSALQNKIDTLMYRGWEPIFKKVKLFKNTINTLKAFKDAGFKLGLLSDFPPETKLGYLGLEKFADGKPIWDAVLCSEHCGVLKPHPLSFLELAKAMSLPPENILYVGNSRPYDVKGAHSAGMKTAWIKPALFPGKGFKKPKADFVFKNYRQLLRYMIE